MTRARRCPQDVAVTHEARRYIVLGAGGVGCALGGSLARVGASIVFIARGAQLAALRDRGLRLMTASRTDVMRVVVVDRPSAVDFERGDVVLLCTKSQDTGLALRALADSAPPFVPVVCAQNGVSNERVAASLFPRVYGALVFSPITFIEPGEVAIHSEPALGGLDIGVYPSGTDELVLDIVSELCAAGFDARAEGRILRLKYGKLLTNLANALQALAGSAALLPELVDPLRAEAIACYHAAGVEFAPADEIFGQNSNIVDLPVEGRARQGGSTWQSLARRSGSIEVDALNGEIVAMGARFGIPTPRNAALAEMARRAAAELWPPGSVSVDDLLAALRSGR